MFGLNRVLATTLTVASTIAVTSGVANAGSLHNGWNYAIDSFNDGANLGVVGPESTYEFYGMAFTEINNSVYIGINSNLSLAGASSGHASDGHIGYGDLFFNFSGNNAQQTNANSGFYGIRFATNSESLAPELGVYSNVQGRNIAQTNSGFKHIKHHRNRVNNHYSGSASLADMNQSGEADAYFGNGFDSNWKVPNSIASGTKIGGINLLDSTALSAAGLDFGHFNASGNYTFGFSFDRGLLPTGDFIAHLFAECINDGLVMKGETSEPIEPTVGPSVPEPGSIAGLAVLAIVGGGSQLRRRQSLGSN